MQAGKAASGSILARKAQSCRRESQVPVQAQPKRHTLISVGSNRKNRKFPNLAMYAGSYRRLRCVSASWPKGTSVSRSCTLRSGSTAGWRAWVTVPCHRTGRRSRRRQQQRARAVQPRGGAAAAAGCSRSKTRPRRRARGGGAAPAHAPPRRAGVPCTDARYDAGQHQPARRPALVAGGGERKHRYGKHLRLYYDAWKAEGRPTRDFWRWLTTARAARWICARLPTVSAGRGRGALRARGRAGATRCAYQRRQRPAVAAAASVASWWTLPDRR